MAPRDQYAQTFGPIGFTATLATNSALASNAAVATSDTSQRRSVPRHTSVLQEKIDEKNIAGQISLSQNDSVPQCLGGYLEPRQRFGTEKYPRGHKKTVRLNLLVFYCGVAVRLVGGIGATTSPPPNGAFSLLQ